MRRIILRSPVILIRIFEDIPLLWMFYFLHFQKEGTGEMSNSLFNAIPFIGFCTLETLLSRNPAKKYITRLVSDNFLGITCIFVSGITLAWLLYMRWSISGELWGNDGILYWVLTILYFSCTAGMFFTTFSIDYLEILGIRTPLRILKNQKSTPPAFSIKGHYAYCRHPLYLFLLVGFWIEPVMNYRHL